MRTVGHRGASAMAPENTLLAIRLAISHRLDFAEVDVHLSRDGQLVVHHDAHFTDGDGKQVPVGERAHREISLAAFVHFCMRLLDPVPPDPERASTSAGIRLRRRVQRATRGGRRAVR
ncbi:MAG: glycerophosphodiester phosphodiesterase [Chloroflexi bacterium]|nr:glycerophosphodiester phosphodiesterase [Chloroflexota bacterium]